MITKLLSQPSLGGDGASKHDQPAGFFVDAVDDPQASRRTFASSPFPLGDEGCRTVLTPEGFSITTMCVSRWTIFTVSCCGGLGAERSRISTTCPSRSRRAGSRQSSPLMRTWRVSIRRRTWLQEYPGNRARMTAESVVFALSGEMDMGSNDMDKWRANQGPFRQVKAQFSSEDLE